MKRAGRRKAYKAPTSEHRIRYGRRPVGPWSESDVEHYLKADGLKLHKKEREDLADDANLRKVTWAGLHEMVRERGRR